MSLLRRGIVWHSCGPKDYPWFPLGYLGNCNPRHPKDISPLIGLLRQLADNPRHPKDIVPFGLLRQPADNPSCTCRYHEQHPRHKLITPCTCARGKVIGCVSSLSTCLSVCLSVCTKKTPFLQIQAIIIISAKYLQILRFWVGILGMPINHTQIPGHLFNVRQFQCS